MKRSYSFLLISVLICMTLGTASAQIIPGGSSTYIQGTDWSPDGKFITYGAGSWDTGYDIMLIPVEGGTPINLTENELKISMKPEFTPDGTEVIYNRWPFNKGVYPSPYPADLTIEAINVETRETRVVIEKGENASFSADGTKIIYAKSLTSHIYGVYDLLTGEETEYDLNDTFQGEKYTSSGVPELSPDNSYFLTTGTADNDFILHGGVPYIYADGEIEGLDYDNNQIYKLYHVSLDTGAAELFDIGEYAYYDPKFSPDGTKLLCTRYDYNNFEFVYLFEYFTDWSIPENWYIKDSDTGEFVRITLENFYYVDEPQVVYEKIRDGVYFTLERMGKKAPKKIGIWEITREVIIYDLITGEVTKVGDPDHYDSYYGSWSPDGTKVCYVRNDEDVSYLYIYDVLNGTYKVVFAEGETGPTAVDDTEPASFTLLNNYPNPFNPTTTIEFSLPLHGNVDIAIYNVMGQKVRELLSEHMNQGTHSLVWNGRDDSGTTVSSGVYLCRLKMDKQIATRRMMLLR